MLLLAHSHRILASSTEPIASLRTATPVPVRSQRRWQHGTQTQTSGSSPAPPPPPPTSAKATSSANSSSHVRDADAAFSSTSAPTSPHQDGNASTSHISRVVPVLGNPAEELGSASNQLSASQAQLTEKQEKELEAKRAEEEWKKQPFVKRAWIKVKEEAAHYWHGTKLLAKEVRISARLLRRLMLGYSLTRREHRQLKRTTADLLRLIPFVPFIIIPAGELLLPVAIKIFPNMLPSTFESKFAVEQKRRGLIKVRLEMAKFLQETIREGGIQAPNAVQTTDEFKEFFRKVRSTGEEPSEEDILKVAKLFDDEVTLDNLTRPQLVSMCRYMQINAFGTDNYLRYQIRAKLNSIKRDDMTISAEGTDNMNLHELQSACQSRGIQTLNLSEERLRHELMQWIQLHLHQRISGTLLILSKAFNYLPQGAEEEKASSQLQSLQLTLSSLPDELIEETELSVSKDSATNKQRLEVLEQQEDLIADEADQEQAEEEARKADKERKKQLVERQKLSQEAEEAKSLLPNAEVQQDPQDARMTNEQLTELGEALSILSAKSSVLKERAELAQLIKEVAGEENISVSELTASESTAASAEQKDSSSSESKESAEGGATSSSVSSASRSLAKRVKAMLKKIDAQLEEYDKDVGSRMHIIETSPSGKISVDDVGQALRLIKHKPDDDVLEKIVDKLDVDNDGLVPLADLVELARQETGLGRLREEDALPDEVNEVRAASNRLREEKKPEKKPRREDIVKEE
ncbi:LETM1-domain-containing protein [Ceraceosorus guamensis]|uniref:Mitochondrial proton/calcium exchanger protein n=1 Tax=Ceraceosorus guamensis TaxID=1522189 RepID=A0A316VRZ5_9BASI|nr:LETM1-domain-containing protein [Ceraceosorus guamensis]PWN40419.1 LETM1-domain-containing protein [Ceraceosorus guamensis]